MLPWDEALIYMQREAQDNTATTLDFLKSMYNVGYQKILGEFGRQVTEKTAVLSLTAGQRSKVVFPDCLFPKTLELVDGTTIQPITEVASDRTWSLMKSGNIRGRPTNYHFKPSFGVNGGILEFYPIPSSSSYTVNFVYEASDKNLSQAKYTTGTITLVANSVAVVGASTVFSASMIGRYLMPTGTDADQMAYRISGFTDATHITLETGYNGSGLTGANYKIVEIPALPVDMHILPCYFALWQWWSSKGNNVKTQEFQGGYILGMKVAKKTHSVVTRDPIVNPPIPVLPFMQYPLNYPTAISE